MSVTMTMSSLAIAAASQTYCRPPVLNNDSAGAAAVGGGGGGAAGGGVTCNLSQGSHIWLRQHRGWLRQHRGTPLCDDKKAAILLSRQQICSLTCRSILRRDYSQEEEDEKRLLGSGFHDALPHTHATPRRERVLRTRTRTHALAADSADEGTSAAEDGSSSSPEEAPAVNLLALKARVLTAIAGLDRGTAASDEDCERVEAAVKELEAVGGGRVNLLSQLPRLEGRWRLIFSSGFSSGSFGGRRPGPAIGRLPLTLGQVYQDINVEESTLDNVVEIRVGAPWPFPRLEATATLGHSLEITDEGNARIRATTVKVKPEGVLQQLPDLALPSISSFFQVQTPLQNVKDNNTRRSGTFSVTYLDQDFRVSRGDRDELRIFLKV